MGLPGCFDMRKIATGYWLLAAGGVLDGFFSPSS